MTLPTVEQVSKAFRTVAQRELGPYTCNLIDLTNAKRGDDGTCASHDHCDANMLMDEALQSLGVVMFPEDAPDDWAGPDEAVIDLWNKAWDHARAVGFNTLIRD